MSVYYNPEDSGLTKITEWELSGEAYQFNILCIWKHENGNYYYAQDSGCSCPSPFENHTGLEDLCQLTDWRDISSVIENSSLEYAERVAAKQLVLDLFPKTSSSSRWENLL